MKYENYELVIANIMPCFWYEEGDEQEQFYVDELTCDCRKFYDNKEFNKKEKETRKWWKIQLYKPNNIEEITIDKYPLCKWLVSESYHDIPNVYDDEDENGNYEKYEWDFKKHCIKL